MRGQAPHEPGAHRRPMDGALLFACMLLAAEDFERRGDPRVPEMPKGRASYGNEGELGDSTLVNTPICQQDKERADARKLVRRYARDDAEFAKFCAQIGLGPQEAT